MAAAVFVRMPAASFSGKDPAKTEAWTDDGGLPYLTDPDSYYHVRLVGNYLDHGMLGDMTVENGQSWDYHSFYPEGRDADYHPMIVWLAAGLHRLTGTGTLLPEYWLSVILAALSALAAYILGYRTAGIPAGLTAGLLTGCAPFYAVRTFAGRFDTDMFLILMELLLILFLTEAMRAEQKSRKLVFVFCFALTQTVYALCWSPRYSMMFAGLTLTGGALFVLLNAVFTGRRRTCSVGEVFRHSGFFTVLSAAILTLAGMFVRSGPGIFRRILSAFSFSVSTPAEEGALPNLFASIAELNKIPLLPHDLKSFFSGYVSGSSSVVNSIGGGMTVLLGIAGLLVLMTGLIRYLAGRPEQRSREAQDPEDPQDLQDAKGFKAMGIYCCVYGAWLAACLFLTRFGVRFVEHLAIPAGLLAGCFTGHAASFVTNKVREREAFRRIPAIAFGAVISAVLILTAAVPALAGARRAVHASRPSVSDSSARAMQYIRDHSNDQDAVIASWWDLGYYYEYSSGHPCLWDGGSTDGIRALLVSRALIADDPELARRILLMLSASGNAAPKLLMEHTDPKTAFETLWQALMMEKEDCIRMLEERIGMDALTAENAASLIHPDRSRETWLVLTYTMTQQIGWYEYYGNWDFTGTKKLPAMTRYSYSPDGTPLFITDEGQGYLKDVRERETIWRLFFKAEETGAFTPAFEWYDGVEHIRVWKVEPLDKEDER